MADLQNEVVSNPDDEQVVPHSPIPSDPSHSLDVPLVPIETEEEEEEPTEEEEEEPTQEPTEEEEEEDQIEEEVGENQPTPTPPPQTYHTPGGVVHRMTARMRVRPPPRTQLAPRDPPPRFAETLQQWRVEEGIPSTYEVGQSSRASGPPPPPLTSETLADTVPLLVARIARQGNQILDLKNQINELYNKVETLTGKIQEMETWNLQSGQVTSQQMGIIYNILEMHSDRLAKLENGEQGREQMAWMTEVRAVMAELAASGAHIRMDALVSLLIQAFGNH